MTDVRRANLEQQAQLYGAPLGDCVREVTGTLGISQAAVARTLGVSAPMLSQLVSGQRIKLGNPQAVHRLQALQELAGEVAAGLPHHRIAPRLAQIHDDDASTLTAGREVALDGPAVVGQVLRAVASGQELSEAAALLSHHGHAALADVLRVYGTGSTQDADRHYAGLGQLIPASRRGLGG